MPAIDYMTVDVFTTTRFSGNQLAVIPDARGLTDAQMQRIAAEFNYSEIAFVLPPRDPVNTARVRIFTPNAEIPFAGHPSVGTSFALARLDDVFGRAIGDAMRFEETAGLVEVDLVREEGAAVGARIKAPRGLEVGPKLDPRMMAACASLRPEDLMDPYDRPPIRASVGLPFVLMELRSLDALARARPNPTAFLEAEALYRLADDHFSLFLYARPMEGDPWRVRARTFTPLSNTPEDPATGGASAALAGYFAARRPEPDLDLAMVVEQGVEMGRPSMIVLNVRKSGGIVHEVTITGRCVPVMWGKIEL